MKQVWILNHYAQEPSRPGGTRHWSLARHLPESGWEASLIAASTEHGSGRERLKGSVRAATEMHGGVRFLWIKTGGYSGNGADRVRNMLQYTLGVLSARNLESLPKPDLIIGSSVHPFAAWAGRRLAKRHKVPFVFEVRDMWPQTLIDMGRIGARHPATVALRMLEKSLYKSACRTISVLPRAVDYIAQFGIDPKKVVWIPNGVETSAFPPPSPKVPGGEFTIMYLGAHGGANGLDNLIDAMAILSNNGDNRRIVLRLIGDGPEKKRLMARGKGLSNVRFEEPVPKSQIPAIAAEADAFVLCVRDLPQLYRFGISMNKMYDYLAAGRPTIISADVSHNPVAIAGAGLTVPPENPALLANAILQLSHLPLKNLEAMGSAGRIYLEEHHDMRKLSRKLAAVLDECVAES